MKFKELYEYVKNNIENHQEIFIERKQLAVQITNTSGKSFYILWKDEKIFLEPFNYNDYDVRIIATVKNIEKLFTEPDYLLNNYSYMNIDGSFIDVMDFRKILSCITEDKKCAEQKDMISDMLLKQDSLKEDLGIIMESMHLLLANSLINLPEASFKSCTKEKNEAISESKITPAPKKAVRSRKNRR